MELFEEFFKKVIDFEGGFNLHKVPGDTGGETYAGISRVHWPDWTGWQLIDGGDDGSARLKAMAMEFFKSNFWIPICGDQILSKSAAFVIFDFAVNGSIRSSAKIAQKVVGAKVDGIIGPKTVLAINNFIKNRDTEELFVSKFSLLRIYRYADICSADSRRKSDIIKSNLKFILGWIGRVERGNDYV